MGAGTTMAPHRPDPGPGRAARVVHISRAVHRGNSLDGGATAHRGRSPEPRGGGGDGPRPDGGDDSQRLDASDGSRKFSIRGFFDGDHQSPPGADADNDGGRSPSPLRSTSARGHGGAASQNGSGVSMRMLLDTNAKLWTENMDLQTAEEAARKEVRTLQRDQQLKHQADQEIIKTLRNELTKQTLGVSTGFAVDTSCERTAPVLPGNASSEHYFKLASSKTPSEDFLLAHRAEDALLHKSSQHSLMDCKAGTSLHSIPEAGGCRADEETIDTLQRENMLLQQLFGEPEGSLMDTSAHTTATCPVHSSAERDLADVHIDSSRHSLPERHGLHEEYSSTVKTSLHSLQTDTLRHSFQDGPYSSIDRDQDLESSKHSCVTAPVNSEYSGDLHIDSSRHSLPGKLLRWHDSCQLNPERQGGQRDRAFSVKKVLEQRHSFQTDSLRHSFQDGKYSSVDKDLGDLQSSTHSCVTASVNSGYIGDLHMDSSRHSLPGKLISARHLFQDGKYYSIDGGIEDLGSSNHTCVTAPVNSEYSSRTDHLHIDSSRHSLQGKFQRRNNPLHSLPGQQSSRINRETIKTLQRGNQLLQKQLGVSNDFKIDMNDARSVVEWLHRYNTPGGGHASSRGREGQLADGQDNVALDMSSEHTIRTAPPESPFSQEEDLRVNTSSRPSLQDIMLGNTSSLHSIPKQGRRRANKDTAQQLHREREGSEHPIRTSALNYSSMTDLHMDSFRRFLQESRNSRGSIKPQSSRFQEDTLKKLRRENKQLRQRLSPTKKIRSEVNKRASSKAFSGHSSANKESGDFANDTRPVSFMGNLCTNSLHSIPENNLQFGATDKDPRASTGMPSRKPSDKGPGATTSAPTRRKSTLRSNSEPMMSTKATVPEARHKTPRKEKSAWLLAQTETKLRAKIEAKLTRTLSAKLQEQHKRDLAAERKKLREEMERRLAEATRRAKREFTVRFQRAVEEAASQRASLAVRIARERSLKDLSRLRQGIITILRDERRLVRKQVRRTTGPAREMAVREQHEQRLVQGGVVAEGRKELRQPRSRKHRGGSKKTPKG